MNKTVRIGLVVFVLLAIAGLVFWVFSGLENARQQGKESAEKDFDAFANTLRAIRSTEEFADPFLRGRLKELYKGQSNLLAAMVTDRNGRAVWRIPAETPYLSQDGTTLSGPQDSTFPYTSDISSTIRLTAIYTILSDARRWSIYRNALLGLGAVTALIIVFMLVMILAAPASRRTNLSYEHGKRQAGGTPPRVTKGDPAAVTPTPSTGTPGSKPKVSDLASARLAPEPARPTPQRTVETPAARTPSKPDTGSINAPGTHDIEFPALDTAPGTGPATREPPAPAVKPQIAVSSQTSDAKAGGSSPMQSSPDRSAAGTRFPLPTGTPTVTNVQPLTTKAETGMTGARPGFATTPETGQPLIPRAVKSPYVPAGTGLPETEREPAKSQAADETARALAEFEASYRGVAPGASGAGAVPPRPAGSSAPPPGSRPSSLASGESTPLLRTAAVPVQGAGASSGSAVMAPDSPYPNSRLSNPQIPEVSQRPMGAPAAGQSPLQTPQPRPMAPTLSGVPYSAPGSPPPSMATPPATSRPSVTASPAGRATSGTAIPSEYSQGLYSQASGLGLEKNLPERLSTEVSRSLAEGTDVSLLLITYEGLTAADPLYPDFTSAIQDYFSIRDLAFESGPGGFALILPNIDVKRAVRLAEDLVRNLKPIISTYHDISASLPLYMGISAVAGRSVPASRVIAEASAALQKARSDQAARIIAFNPDPSRYKKRSEG